MTIRLQNFRAFAMTPKRLNSFFAVPRSKVFFSDNWFAARRWQPFVEAMHEERTALAVKAAEHHAKLAAWVRDRSPMCRHISPGQMQALVASRLVTADQLRAAGLTG